MLFTILVILVLTTQQGTSKPSALHEFLHCRLCDSVRLTGRISDCQCDFESVNEAVSLFYAPLLHEITTSTFFRYFKVDLDRPCPFWHEQGQCMMEGCSVCTCDEREVPQNWFADYSKHAKQVQEKLPSPVDMKASLSSSQSLSTQATFSSSGAGWVSSASSQYGYTGGGHDDSLGRLLPSSSPESGASSAEQEAEAALRRKYLQETEDDSDDDDDWTSLDNEDEGEGSSSTMVAGAAVAHQQQHLGFAYGYLPPPPPPPLRRGKAGGVFVNLLQNPETFTGYSGPSARRVWQAIQEENCFTSSGEQDQCLERRAFYRLMSGLQASISTHIAKEYLFPNKRWGRNLPLFVKAVGSHRTRVENLYFAFLFVLRAAVKAHPALAAYSYDTGNVTEDAMVRALVVRLTASTVTLPQGQEREKVNSKDKDLKEQEMALAQRLELMGERESDCSAPVERCRHAFDEGRLFHVSGGEAAGVAGDGGVSVDGGSAGASTVYAQHRLQREFQERFRNISRIMDCVSCEKCKVWGKLQILGIGTAIKILLTPSSQLEGWGGAGTLSRQEIVALVNTLHQLAASVKFAAEAAEAELSEKMEAAGQTIMAGSGVVGPALIFVLVLLWLRRQELGFGQKDATRNGVEIESGTSKEKAQRKRDWISG